MDHQGVDQAQIKVAPSERFRPVILDGGYIAETSLYRVEQIDQKLFQRSKKLAFGQSSRHIRAARDRRRFMKILFDHSNPFLLAHGGFQIQIEQTKAALEQAGVEVEYLRWWDDRQSGELIHYFGRPSPGYLELARRKRLKVVFTHLHGGLGVRSPLHRFLQRLVIKTAQACFPSAFLDRLAWETYRVADACIVVTPWEAELVRTMFEAPPGKTHVVLNGIEEVFLRPNPIPRDQWLVTTASILPVKRIIETAQAAVAAQTPYRVIGKPLAEDDPYYRAFLELCRKHPDVLRYEGAVADREQLARCYRQARGFVLLSQWESLSISALEAAACDCPLLLNDLPWARSIFGEHARYCRPGSSTSAIAAEMRRFYDEAPRLDPPPKPKSWLEIGRQLNGIYEGVLSTSR